MDISGIQERNTSAYAEKTLRALRRTGMPEKHLRLRGENPVVRAAVAAVDETPPLTRRKP